MRVFSDGFLGSEFSVRSGFYANCSVCIRSDPMFLDFKFRFFFNPMVLDFMLIIHFFFSDPLVLEDFAFIVPVLFLFSDPLFLDFTLIVPVLYVPISWILCS